MIGHFGGGGGGLSEQRPGLCLNLPKTSSPLRKPHTSCGSHSGEPGNRWGREGAGLPRGIHESGELGGELFQPLVIPVTAGM